MSGSVTMGLFPFADASEPSDSSLLGIVEAERERQFSQLVMIPSESIPHPAAVSVLTSALGNIYAEGLPQPLLCPNPRATSRDPARFASWPGPVRRQVRRRWSHPSRRCWHSYPGGTFLRPSRAQDYT